MMMTPLYRTMDVFPEVSKVTRGSLGGLAKSLYGGSSLGAALGGAALGGAGLGGAGLGGNLAKSTPLYQLSKLVSGLLSPPKRPTRRVEKIKRPTAAQERGSLAELMREGIDTRY